MDTILPAAWVARLGPTVAALVVAVVAAIVGLILHTLLFRVFTGVWTPAEPDWRQAFREHCRHPLAWLLPAFLASIALPTVGLEGPGPEAVGRLLTILLIVTMAWFFIGVTGVLRDLFLQRFRIDVRDNLRARRIHTQVDILRKILIVVIAFLALGAVLMSFELLRELGTGILASAGIAGLVVGFAAQRTLANVLAGFQIALTQPIRIDDVVVVEGEWGWIEEITLTYVVVRVWDQRRLVLPISYFIENPIQNWTRTSAEILGTVFLRVDHTVPIDELREEVGRAVERNEHWDGRVWRLHVTEAGDRALEVRALMSAADSPSAWELRCRVREELVGWLQENHPDALPRIRAEIEEMPGAA